MLASKTRKKREKTSFGHDKIFFFKISHDEYSYNTPYLQHCIWKKMFLRKKILREFSSAAPSIENAVVIALVLNFLTRNEICVC